MAPLSNCEGHMEHPTFDYLSSVLGDRSEIEWFTDALVGSGAVTGPLDVYLRTSDGAVTWGWSVEPIPLEMGDRRFRRLRHPDGWVMLVDVDDPEMLALPHALDLHTISHEQRVVRALVLEAGSIPDTEQATDLARTSLGYSSSVYRIDPGWPVEITSAALSLWVEAHLGRQVRFVHRQPTETETGEMSALISAPESEVETLADPLDVDEEIAEIVAPFEMLVWFQEDLSWPDRHDRQAFRDRVDVRARDEHGTMTWLAAVEAPDSGEHVLWVEGDGITVGLDPSDPTQIELAHDRLVLAVHLPQTGYEPAGLAVELGSAPRPEQWEQLRSSTEGADEATLIAAPAWSEDRISRALAVWAWAWSGYEVEFAYDPDDPVPRAAIEANQQLAQGLAAGAPLRTNTPPRCSYREPGEVRFEDPLPCNRRATHYYETPAGMVMVCEMHVPEETNVSRLMRS